MSERRVAPRQKSFLRGCIYFNNRRSVMDCLVRDLTEDGARIIFSHAVNVPDIVELYIPQKEQTLRARVKWRRGDDVGLDFTEPRGGRVFLRHRARQTRRATRSRGRSAQAHGAADQARASEPKRRRSRLARGSA